MLDSDTEMSEVSDLTEVGVLIPTLFSRPEYLEECIKSVRKSGNVSIFLMGPECEEANRFIKLVDHFLPEPAANSLAEKLNFGLSSFPKEIEYVTWIGDDDLLAEGSMSIAQNIMKEKQDVVMVFGDCLYIDNQGKVIGNNNLGSFAKWIMSIGPFLVPQPGSLYRRTAVSVVGGLDPSLSLAFDFDLALKLRKLGKIEYIPQNQASYRWHKEALSVKLRDKSVAEASLVRRQNSSGLLRLVVLLLNPFVALATKFAGTLLGRSHRPEPKN